AADQGDDQARKILPPLYQESFEWLRSAASEGVALAQNGLGVLYARGLGVPEDINEAAKWWLLAANQGDPDAQASLGYLYESGSGVKKDYVQAYVWYSLIVADYPSDANASQGRQAVAKKLTPAQLAEAQVLI